MGAGRSLSAKRDPRVAAGSRRQANGAVSASVDRRNAPAGPVRGASSHRASPRHLEAFSHAELSASFDLKRVLELGALFVPMSFPTHNLTWEEVRMLPRESLWRPPSLAGRGSAEHRTFAGGGVHRTVTREVYRS